VCAGTARYVAQPAVPPLRAWRLCTRRRSEVPAAPAAGPPVWPAYLAGHTAECARRLASGRGGAQARFATFDEAARQTEQFLRAPPVEPARSGNDFYTAQPFQILSWYPRCVRPSPWCMPVLVLGAVRDRQPDEEE
jgi:hypothetical protein